MKALLLLLSIFALASCGPTMSPREAWEIESRQCARRRDPELVRRCESLVEKKYARYFGEGQLPELDWPR